VGSSVLVLTLLSALNPVRLGLTLLVISRLRPVQNLFAYSAGCLTGAIPAVVVPLALMHFTPMSGSFTQGEAANSTVRHVQIGMGALALSTAAVMTVRSLTRRRQRARLPAQVVTSGRHRKASTTSTVMLDRNTPTAISRLLDRAQDAPTKGGWAFWRLLRRAQNAWENGSLWIAYLIGLGFGGPQPDVALFVVAIIAASGAAIGTQLITAIAFVVGTLAVVEIILVSYLVTPARTHAVLRPLHDWVSDHRRKILVAIFAVVGVAMVTQGMDS
jgi:hypothetical protein